MHVSFGLVVLVFALTSAFAVPAHAADTGTVSGVVFDRNGQPVDSATVKISGARLPMGRTVQTGANGTYRFEYLLPGEYLLRSTRLTLGAQDAPRLSKSRRTPRLTQPLA